MCFTHRVHEWDFTRRMYMGVHKVERVKRDMQCEWSDQKNKNKNKKIKKEYKNKKSKKK